MVKIAETIYCISFGTNEKYRKKSAFTAVQK
jgi:hypothetical protein